MKKQYFIYSVITCMLVIFNVKAQNTPIDDFLKRYPSKEDVIHVSISQQMLRGIFDTTYLNRPEAYGSVSVSKTDNPAILFADFRKTLLSSNYEQIMEVNNENSNILCYFLKADNRNRNRPPNEIVVLRQQKNQFSAIYIKGRFELVDLEQYLRKIQFALARMGAYNTGIYPDRQFAFTLPSFDNFNFPNFKEFDFKFDSDAFNFKMDEDLKLRMEESMKKIRDAFEGEDFQRKIKDSMDDVQRRIEDAQRQ